VGLAGRDLRDAGQPRHLDRGCVVGRRPDAELAERVVAPGPDGAIGLHRETVLVTSRDLRHPPRPDRAVGLQRQNVLVSGGDLDHAGQAGHRGRAQAVDRGDLPVAEFSVAVVAPRVDGAVGEQRGAEYLPLGDLPHIGQPADLGWHDR